MNSRILNRDFLLLSQGQLVNQAGTQIALAATAFWLKQSTDSASLLGLMSAISALPLLLLGPLGGAVADRWSRRNILIVCDVWCGVVSCALAMLLRSHAPGLAMLTAGLFAGNLILSSAIAFTSPALNALIPSLVAAESIGAAMAFSQASGFLAMVLGQFLAGLLLTHYTPSILYWLDAGTYFVSAAAESMVRPDAPAARHAAEAAQRTGIFQDIAEGFSYVWRRRGMRALLLAAIPLNMLTTPVIMLLPFYASNSLHQPLARYGYLLAGLSVGILAGYAIGGRFQPPPRHRHSVVFGCVIGCAGTILALASLEGLWPALIALTLLGTLIGVVTLVALNAFIQHTESEKRGRVAAVLLMVTQGLTPLAMSLVGVVSDLLGNNIRLLYGGCAILLFTAALAMFINRDLREFLSQP
jgi:DHA3 family macrolide efflux protein-like MFS transporter